jgi:tetratricopeptide (TPR) repeat protein
MKESALRYYLNAYSKLPDDNTLETKIGDILFDLKRFDEAYSFYKKIPFQMLSAEERQRIVKTMYYANVPTKESDLPHLGFGPDEKDYYLGIVSHCYTGIHNCILAIQSYTGTTYPAGAKLVDAVKNYEKISADFHYRNALVAGIFLANNDYRAAAIIGEEILMKRPGYMSALKLVGFSRYELGDYAKANTVLQKYYEYDPKDIKTSYILGIVNYELNDYVTSNLYFNTAVLNGYEPKTELERRMIYNYFVLDDHKSMFKVFRYLLDEPDVNMDDYIIAIYTAIEKRELSKASLWCDK